MQRAIGYVRVATDREASVGTPLETQRAKLEAYCAAQGLDLAQVFADVGSGTTLARPGLLTLLAAVRKGDVVVVLSLSRLSRKLRDTLDVSERLDKVGATLVCITELLDSGTGSGKFAFRTMAVMAEYERDHRVEQRVEQRAAQRSRKGA